VNATLSLGYTLLYSRAVQACWVAGLDPLVGFLHMPSHGRASLACDLMETWRAHIEQWIWSMWRSQSLRPEHFGRDGAQACLMGKAGRAIFYAAVHEPLSHCERGLMKQARLLARLLMATTGHEGWASDPHHPWEADISTEPDPDSAAHTTPIGAEDGQS
jgi:CRISPR-associated protein Cas1